MGIPKTGGESLKMMAWRWRQPRDVFKVMVKIGGVYQEIHINNQWTIPPNRKLSVMFNAHINVEYYDSVTSIKYICKYVNKASNQAIFGLQKDGETIDELSRYKQVQARQTCSAMKLMNSRFPNSWLIPSHACNAIPFYGVAKYRFSKSFLTMLNYKWIKMQCNKMQCWIIKLALYILIC